MSDNKKFKKINREKGVVLLLSLIIMSTVVAVSIGLSVLVINQFQASSGIDQSITAFYAAETGLEKHLETVKNNRNVKSLKDAIGIIDGTDGLGGETGFLTQSKASWNTSGSSVSEEYIIRSLAQNQSILVDLFDPDDPTVLGGAESVKIEWSDDCLGESWLETSLVTWQPGALITYQESAVKNIFPCSSNGRPCVDHISTEPQANQNHRIRITALYCDASHIRITPYDHNDPTDPSASVVAVTNRLNIKSVGTNRDSQVAASASVPWHLAPQGIFEFVLFSEAAIEK